MTGVLPHSKITHAHCVEYLTSVKNETGLSVERLKKCPDYKGTYKACLSGHLVLPRFAPKSSFLLASANVARRIPLLIACQQLVSADIQLRRVIEMTVLHGYFREHPVELARFMKYPTEGFARDRGNPIAFCAHREFSWFADYCVARVADDPSGLGTASLATMREHYSSLSAQVHIGLQASSTNMLTDSFDDLDSVALNAFTTRVRSIMAAAVTLLGVLHPERVARLNAIERGWFDWLVGASSATAFRSAQFGASRT